MKTFSEAVETAVAPLCGADCFGIDEERLEAFIEQYAFMDDFRASDIMRQTIVQSAADVYMLNADADGVVQAIASTAGRLGSLFALGTIVGVQMERQDLNEEEWMPERRDGVGHLAAVPVEPPGTNTSAKTSKPKASKLVYDFCCERGICVLCRRHFAQDGRMCHKCRRVSKRAQKNFRDRKNSAK